MGYAVAFYSGSREALRDTLAHPTPEWIEGISDHWDEELEATAEESIDELKALLLQGKDETDGKKRTELSNASLHVLITAIGESCEFLGSVRTSLSGGAPFCEGFCKTVLDMVFPVPGATVKEWINGTRRLTFEGRLPAPQNFPWFGYISEEEVRSLLDNYDAPADGVLDSSEQIYLDELIDILHEARELGKDILWIYTGTGPFAYQSTLADDFLQKENICQ